MSSWDDDFVDRMNHWWTSVIIIICAVIVSAKQYVGVPIKCWVPQQFSGAWTQYAENYCWVQNTYFVPKAQEIPTKQAIRTQQELSYYQWVPYVFALMALMFYLPHMIWRLLNWYSGVNVQSLVTMSCDAANVDPSKRKETINTVSRYMEDSLMVIDESKNSALHRIKRCLLCLCGTRRMGNYLASLYLIVKILYIVNIIGQFFLLNSFLGTPYNFYGIQILKDLAAGREWTESGHFPRVTMCDFQIRTLGQRHNYTVQCVLVINLFNEKIFIFLWFWFFIVAIFSIGSLFYWIFRMLMVRERYKFIKHFLKVSKTYTSKRYSSLFSDFVHKRLKTDGVFLLRLINLNAGDIIATDLITDMWRRYRESRPEISANPEEEEVMV